MSVGHVRAHSRLHQQSLQLRAHPAHACTYMQLFIVFIGHCMLYLPTYVYYIDREVVTTIDIVKLIYSKGRLWMNKTLLLPTQLARNSRCTTQAYGHIASIYAYRQYTNTRT